MNLAPQEDSQALARAKMSLGISAEDRYFLAVHGLEQDIVNAKRILDVGCGEGHFGRFLRRTLGWQGCLVGTDIHRYAGVSDEVYDQWHGWNINQTTGLPQECFDLIFACEALHHGECPRRTVRSLSTCLKPDGSLVFTTPNPLSFASLMTLVSKGSFRDFQDHPEGLRYPTQITPILPLDAIRMFQECEFERPAIRYSDRMRLPATTLTLQSVFPFAGGRWFSDCYRAMARRPGAKGSFPEA